MEEGVDNERDGSPIEHNSRCQPDCCRKNYHLLTETRDKQTGAVNICESAWRASSFKAY